MRKKKIDVKNSVGKILQHDITEVVPGKFKGVAFKKGHIIKESDISKFLKLGKEKIWTLKISDKEYHENEAAEKFKGITGENVITTGPVEGKITFVSKKTGLLIVEKEIVNKINKIPDILFATLHSDVSVKKGEKIAGIRIIPLITLRSRVKKVLNISKTKKPLQILPFKKKKTGLIITGNEIAKGRIKDKFKPILEKKIEAYGSNISAVKILPDEKNLIKEEILLMAKSCDLILITGGMSVDPDDVTKLAIKETEAKIISYGVPALPGNMLLVAYLNEKPIFGIPAASLFYKITSLDLFLPFVFADKKIVKSNIVQRGYGGFCSHCKVCNFPQCGFGKC